MKKLKVVTVMGTRPEIIRLSRVMTKLDKYCDHVMVHTGQNHDYELNEIFFRDLELRKPDHFLNAAGVNGAETIGKVIVAVDKVLAEIKPEALLVLGDTNSCMAVIPAKRRKIPVFHMEAGNRCFDENVPEETNRRLVDHIADFNLVYTEHARRNLLAEGLHPRRVLLTGSPMREVLDFYRPQIGASDVLTRLGLKKGGYFLVSAHREENVDPPQRLRDLLDCLLAVRDRWAQPILVSTHPRTRKRLEALKVPADLSAITFSEPFGFHDYINLQKNARCVLSDSGTISEESSILGFPAVTLRSSIERPEALESGSILLTDLRRESVIAGIVAAETDQHLTSGPQDYQSVDCSIRVRNIILSTSFENAVWAGLR